MARVRLTVEFEPELGRRMEDAASSHETSVREWIEYAVRRGLEREEADGDLISRLSERLFARDWESEKGAIYDELDR